jgi:glycosyltransferase involved in cell wall biosynthesis
MPSITRTVLRELQRQPQDILFTIYWYWDARIFHTTARKVIDANDVQSHRVERLLERTDNVLDRLLKDWLLRRYRQMEADTLRQADLVVAITERDRKEFEAMTGGTVDQVVIPTGLDTDHFKPQGEPRPQHVGFFGSLRNPMNRDAVVHLLDDIWPQLRRRFPDLTLSLIGAGASAEIQERVAQHPEISLTGYVEDIRAPISQCQAILLPLRIGWGIRGRVYEILSLGVPVIASPVSVDGMDLPEGEGIVRATRPEEIAVALERLLQDPEHRRQMGQRGRRVAVEQASFAATYDRLARDLATRW